MATNDSFSAAWRLGVDVGGTFTDVALEGAGRRYTAKVLTTAQAPAEGVVTAIRQALAQAQIGPAEVGVIIHGTTLATNAIIERKGARTALLTTAGFRDVLQLGSESRFDQYDLYLEKPAPLVPRRWRFPIPERLNGQGQVLLLLDESAVSGLLPHLQALGVESVAVAFLHAYANPDHEQRVRELLLAALPELAVSLSSEVSPEIREYDRFSTTCANAYVQPLIARYLNHLQSQLRAEGFTGPLLTFLSNGGLTDVATASRFPVRLIESGPAGGALLASHLAAECDLAQVISFDMGGTTAKLCLIDGAKPDSARNFEVARTYRFRPGSGLPLRIPVIDMVEIGAGGGSLSRVNPLGLIEVGPDSAGAEPGPACYGRGGQGATVTDANLLLGRLEPAAFAGGQLQLDRAAAEAAIGLAIAGPLSLPRQIGAVGIIEMVDENMANAAREHAVEKGKSLAGRTLIAFGGCAPLHAARLAEKLGLKQVLIPSGAGVGSAIGFLRAPVAYEIVRSRYQRLSQLEPELINPMLAEMTTTARDFVRRASPAQALHSERLAFMRYRGQRHEIAVPLPDHVLSQADIGPVRAAFDRAYLAQFGRIIPHLEVEVLSWSVAVRTTVAPPAPPPPTVRRSPAEPFDSQPLFDLSQGKLSPARRYHRADLGSGVSIPGPALILEAETSTVVPAGWRVRLNEWGYLVLERPAEQNPAPFLSTEIHP
jgi:N-methylhydantoinase A